MVNVRRCTVCKETKSETDFYTYFSKAKNKILKCYKCKICHQKTNLESVKRTGSKKRYIETHRVLFSHSVSKFYQNLRHRILVHYGGDPPKCSICGETIDTFLCIDHINGCGEKRRKEQGRGPAFYYWIVKNNFPNGYRILCHNCNMIAFDYKLKDTKRNGSMREVSTNRKFSIMAIYSEGNPKCSCCEEENLKCLAIDHVDNNGAVFRRTHKQLRGSRFYNWIIRNDFPNDLQVLCYNCNMGKRLNHGVCPHKLGELLSSPIPLNT